MELLTIEQQRDLAVINTEAAAITGKAKWSRQDEARLGYLKMSSAAILRGATLRELDEANLNEMERRNGLPISSLVTKHPSLSRAKEVEARGWKNFVETRDMVEGDPKSRIGTFSGLGYFVPNSFFPDVKLSMKAHDALFDGDAVTVINSTNGRPLPLPLISDTDNVASVVSEAGSQTSVDIDATGQAVVGAYSYSTPRFVASLESFDDLEGNLSVVELFKQFSADRLARGIGADMVNGNGTNKTLGLIPSLSAVGAPVVTAQGASANTGGSELGSNSLGSIDFATAYQTLDSAYVNSPKAAWFMSHSTLAYLESIVTKYGEPLKLVHYETGVPRIFGIRVRICPSMDPIGASNIPVVLGDGSYWVTRIVTDEFAGVKVYTEAPGLAEQGNVGLRTFVRADGALLFKDSGSSCPFVVIRMHS